MHPEQNRGASTIKRTFKFEALGDANDFDEFKYEAPPLWGAKWHQEASVVTFAGGFNLNLHILAEL